MPNAFESSGRSKKNGVAREALKSRATDVMDDFVELKKDIAKLAEAANRAAISEVDHAGHKFQTLRRQARDQASSGLEDISERVRERPGAAVGVSLGLGLLLGMLLTARR